MELPCPYEDLTPDPVPGCPKCAELDATRYKARKRREFAVAVVASQQIRHHEQGHHA
ncbi:MULTISPECIES: hypothetical protein [Streptomyces]|uniref:Deoxyxylulose-5-phosphate synthase n=1 Tax=Streptomyces bugieae TaxID=3098223 RepID=A0ABU7P3B0_9ACTN|nr:hypothetical protein [Streptomyces nigrescens]MEE4425476.1 hypothetical protein [Streptomyces sp. DSM 41528]